MEKHPKRITVFSLPLPEASPRPVDEKTYLIINGPFTGVVPFGPIGASTRGRVLAVSKAPVA